MKKMLILIILCVSVFAQAEIQKTNIDISIDRVGNAQVKEELTIKADAKISTIFEDLIEKEKAGFDSWKALIPDLEQHVKSLESPIISATKTEVKEGQFQYKIGMEYTVPKFAEITNSKGRIENWEVRNIMLTYYDIESQKLMIPDKTYITLGIEDTRKEKTQPASDFFQVIPKNFVKGPYVQEENRIVFFINGPISAENFKIEYKIEMTINESFEVKSILTFFEENIIYTIILGILIILTIIFRKQIFSILEDTFITDEDIIMPRDRK